MFNTNTIQLIEYYTINDNIQSFEYLRVDGNPLCALLLTHHAPQTQQRRAIVHLGNALANQLNKGGLR